jgi:hypothetical protein
VWIIVLVGVLAALVALLLWRHGQSRRRIEREREERRARTDQMLARALVGEDRPERHTVGGPRFDTWPPTTPTAIDPKAGPQAAPQPVDMESLLGGEPTSIADQARRQLERPTTLLSGLAGESTLPHPERAASGPSLSLLDGKLDVALDALVVAWFAARGYMIAPAPATAAPIRLLLTHRDDRERSYAFYFDRGRLQAQRATALLEAARALGVNRLLVAAEHGAEAAVHSGRLRDVLVMDWVALDHELRKLDFRIAAKLVAFARTRRADLGLG